jgi:hypothetical protein
MDNQNMLDLAVQECGGVASVFDFAMLNGLSITEVPDIGVKLEVPTVKAVPEIALFFKKHSTRIATAPTSAADHYIQQLFENGLFQPGLFE